MSETPAPSIESKDMFAIKGWSLFLHAQSIVFGEMSCGESKHISWGVALHHDWQSLPFWVTLYEKDSADYQLFTYLTYDEAFQKALELTGLTGEEYESLGYAYPAVLGAFRTLAKGYRHTELRKDSRANVAGSAS
jgi:hypothetical protein